MAISFTVAGLAVPAPAPARLYRFRNDDSYAKLRATVDACAAEWVSDPAQLLMIDASPYVLVMEGAIDAPFADALRAVWAASPSSQAWLELAQALWSTGAPISEIPPAPEWPPAIQPEFWPRVSPPFPAAPPLCRRDRTPPTPTTESGR